MSDDDIQQEWPLMLDTTQIEGDESFDVSPNDAQAKAIAARLSLLSLDSLTASGAVHNRAGKFHLTGSLTASVTQECVVTGEPVRSEITDEFEGWFIDHDTAVSFAKVRQEKLKQNAHAETPILDERDDPESLIDGHIDLGEQIVQFLSLSINPYPHAEGADYPIKEGDKEAMSEIRKNPFSVLKDWKDGKL